MQGGEKCRLRETNASFLCQIQGVGRDLANVSSFVFLFRRPLSFYLPSQ